MKKVLIYSTLCLFLLACEQAKEADVDRDGTADVFVKGIELKDANKQDNIFIIDGVVVNGVTNEQWYVKNGVLEIVEKPTFKMTYNSIEQKWEKLPIE